MTMEGIRTDGFLVARRELEALMLSDPRTEKEVQQLIRRVLHTVQRDISQAAASSMREDPRQAYKAVKTVIYKRVLGGAVNILNRRRRSGGASAPYEPPRKKRDTRRGGNRVKRSDRTEDVMSYQGQDRAFILRFINAGTAQRTAGSRGGKLSGNRGRILPRRFFGTASAFAMQRAAEDLADLIDGLILNKQKQ